ncbi:hypothetical protein J5N52_04630 [Acinetobacter soli]|uniref:hypothetical protein n=1 Tax=Acinetobacter soli TaxID=487316 RepID=UPI001ABC89B3|nr:hypothetical protein [Acinetobacter soli]MBO3671309.1 hypothetical protein [Acinetobacter soli]
MINKKREIISLFIVALIFLCIGINFYGLVFETIAPLLFQKDYDKGALASMIGWSGTLFIGYAGYLLLDRWKDQEHRKIIRDNAFIAFEALHHFLTSTLNQIYVNNYCETDSKMYEESFYKAYFSLYRLNKLTDDPELKEQLEKLGTIYKEVSTIRIKVNTSHLLRKDGHIQIKEQVLKIESSITICSHYINIHNF